MKSILNRLDSDQKDKIGEVVRFGIVGVLATVIQYVVYLLLIGYVHTTLANTIGYLISFIFNFYASIHFTFKVKASAKRGAGFALSHLINWGLQTVSLIVFVYLGVPKPWAPLPMFAVCIPINFLLVRFFLKH